MNGASRRLAFTLIEMLLVVGIIAVLIGLLAPAVQKVRNAASRIRCANNLKQIGLSLHQYHDARQMYPPGCSYRAGSDPMPHVSWMTRILPYLEQEGLWQEAVTAFARDKFFQAQPHLLILARPNTPFTCTSDWRVSHSWAFGNLQVALASYQGVSGTNRTAFDGLLYLDSRVRVTGILDGTSNTVAVGERPPSADAALGWWYAGWGQAKDGSADLHLGAREVNVSPRYVVCGRGPYSFKRGEVRDNCDAFHFWSLHPGGAHFLFVDGSARFLTYGAESILPLLATRAGGEVSLLP